MNKELILQIFKAAYNRQSFIDNVLLPTLQGKVDKLEIYDEQGAQEVELTPSEEQYVKSAVKYVRLPQQANDPIQLVQFQLSKSFQFLRSFHLRPQQEVLGNIQQLDFFLNLGLSEAARIMFKFENLLLPSFSENSFRIQDYPIPGRVLKVGLSWRMLN